MPWVRLDDRFHSNPKIRRAWRSDPSALGLYVLALSYAAGHLTDGAIPTVFVEDEIQSPARRKKVVGILEEAGLWERNGSGWMIHDFLEYNESAEDVRVRRHWDVTRKSLERDRDLTTAIKARDADRCRYCGIDVNWRDRRGPTGGTYDHVIPRGPNTLANVVVACRRCNVQKGGRSPEEAGMVLRDQPI
jgi:HNH endonuclease